MKRSYWYIFWLTAALLLFYGNGSILITDSVESNYALTAKEMVLSGDWISPQIYGNYWFDKPVMFYWLTAAAFKVFGFTEFAARFFPAMFGLAALGLIFWGGSKLYNSRAGFFSSMILLSSMEFFLISKSVITDAVLFLFFSSTMLFFYLGYSSGNRYYWYIMYLSAALATLTKGPVGFLLPGLIITLFMIWQKDWKLPLRMHLLSGISVFALAALPWYGMMIYLHGADFLNTFLGTHNFLRATVSEHPRDNVIYYYAAVNLLAFFPWSMLVPIIIYRIYRQGDFSLPEKERFLLLWAAVVFVFFQCMATKYITYTYPMLFPAALLLGSYLQRQEEVLRSKVFIAMTAAGFLLLATAGTWVVSAGIAAGKMLFLLPLSLAAGVAGWFFLQKYDASALCSISYGSIVFYIALTICIAVPFSAQRSAKELGRLLPRLTSAESVGVYGNYPTSAVFYSGKRIVKLMPAGEMARFAPQAYSWNSKNVMPYAAVEEERFPLVIVGKKRLEDFAAATTGLWDEKAVLAEWVIVQSANKAG